MNNEHNQTVWIDPQSGALSFLKPIHDGRPEGRGNASVRTASAPSQRVTERNAGAKRQGAEIGSTHIIDAEFEDLGVESQGQKPTRALARAERRDLLKAEQELPLAGVPAAPTPPETTYSSPLDLAQLEKVIRQMERTLDLDLPDGWLDAWLSGPTQRMQRTVDRMDLMNQFQTAVVVQLRGQCDAAEEVRRFNEIRYKQFSELLVAWRTAAEEHYRLALAQENVEHERAIASAKTRAEVKRYETEAALHERTIRDSRSDLLPPPAPPPSPPPPPTDEECAVQRRKDHRRKRMEMVHERLDEFDAWARFGQQKVSKAKARAIRIFRNLQIPKDEKRTRIGEILDAYQIDERILPPAIRELMEEEVYDDE